MKLGEKIQTIRKEKGYSQESFAKLLNIGRSTLANYEQCKRDPNYNTVELIADKLSVSPSYLMGWEDENIMIDGETINSLKIDIDYEEDKDLYKLFTISSQLSKEKINALLVMAKALSK